MKTNFIASHPKSIFSAYFLGLFEPDIASVSKLCNMLYQKLIPDVQDSYYGKNAKKAINEYISVLPGTPLPVINGFTPDGKAFNTDILKEMDGKGIS